jgi:hypothetical protein
MYHRYGRHGPHAWKRRRQRRFQQRLPAVVPTVAVVRIQVPITTERIILIIMPDGNAREEWEETQFQIGGDQTGSLVVASEHGVSQNSGEASRASSPLQQVAHRRAVDDARRVEEIVDGGQYVNLDLKRLSSKGRKHAEDDITNNDLRDNPHVEYEDLLKEYQGAYQRKFQEKIRFLAEWVTIVRDEKERQLRDILSRDRAQMQTLSPDDRHAHDLVLIRILQVYYWGSLEEVDINVLLERRALIKRYEKFVLDFESRNEVTWPDRDSFRS